MIPKKHHLIINNKTPFLGKKSSGHWATYITKSSPLCRWSIRISKQVYPLATDRNLLRRQINHWLYRELNNLHPQEFLIILRHSPQSRADLSSLFAEIEQHLFVNQ